MLGTCWRERMWGGRMGSGRLLGGGRSIWLGLDPV